MLNYSMAVVLILGGNKLIEELYALNIWPTDPHSEFSQRRFREAVEVFGRLMEHDWFQELLRKEKVRILEICAGAGIGGVALAKVLMERGVDVELLLTDIRENDLELGSRWGSEVLGRKVDYVKMDSRRVHELGRRFDIALMYGFSSPHFDPWDMVRLQASVSECLADDGILIMDEGDRRYSIFYQTGYARILPERIDNERALLSLHAGYNFKRGTFKRAYLDLKNPSKTVITEVYFWGLAELMAMVWIFFQDVDFYELRRGAGLILGYKPRRKIRIGDLQTQPRVLLSQP